MIDEQLANRARCLVNGDGTEEAKPIVAKWLEEYTEAGQPVERALKMYVYGGVSPAMVKQQLRIDGVM